MRNILVFDDIEHDLEAMQNLLRDHGYASVQISEVAGEVVEALERSERKLHDLFVNAPIGIFRSSLDGKLLSVNPAVARILKYDSPEEMIRIVNRTNIVDALYVDPNHRPIILDAVLSGDGWQVFEERFRCKDGSVITCNFHLRAVSGDSGSAELDGFIENITDRKQVEDSLRLTQCCVDHAFVDIFIVTPDEAKILYANDHMCRNLGYTREELTSMTSFDLDPFLVKERVGALERQFQSDGSLGPFETFHRRKDGTLFPVEVTANRMMFEGRELAICFAQDISARKQAEEQLKASLEEKEVLLKEIHHRVKNNLQVISSLLFLQAQRIQDPALAAHFIESQNRIYSMALAHEKLYQSKNLADVRLPSYVGSLVEQIEQVFRLGEKPVVCRVAVEDVVLDIEQVIPCGLLITELLSNALRHAFPDGRRGKVAVDIGRKDDFLWLKVRDDGVGLPAELNLLTVKTLGLQLVQAVVDQLDGKLELQRKEGTSFQVIFPIRRREGANWP